MHYEQQNHIVSCWMQHFAQYQHAATERKCLHIWRLQNQILLTWTGIAICIFFTNAEAPAVTCKKAYDTLMLSCKTMAIQRLVRSAMMQTRG